MDSKNDLAVPMPDAGAVAGDRSMSASAVLAVKGRVGSGSRDARHRGTLRAVPAGRRTDPDGGHESAGLPQPPLPPQEKQIALFLDLDGTLAPLAERPELVQVHAAGIALLARLRDRLDGAMAILSGRSLEQVDAILSPLKLTAAGVHGAQLRRTSDAIETFVPAEWARTQVEQACRSVALPQGVWLETKAALSFAFHFRAAPGRATWVAQQARSIAARTGGAYVVQFGDGVAEVRPGNADKGTALLSLMQSPAFIGRLPVVIGDDLTDEAAFREARLWEGTSVLVGERSPTHATYRLESPAAVHDWLASLLHRLERREGTAVA